MLAADCRNVGLVCKAICCSSSSVIRFWSGGGVWDRPGKATKNKAQEKETTKRITRRSADTVSTLTRKNFTGIIKLFMVVLHPRHIHLHWFIAFLLFSKLHDLVVLVWRQNAHECHHSRHEAAPAGTPAKVCRLAYHFIHRPHGTSHQPILLQSRP